MSAGQNAVTQLVDLRTNSLTEPLAIESGHPVFSWRMESNLIGQMQTEYLIKVNAVSGSEWTLAWNSGKVTSGISFDIRYGSTGEPAAPLSADTRYRWTVTVWDMDGNAIESEPGHFETGLMDSRMEAWDGAQWIGPSDYYLDADTLAVYRIRFKAQIPEGSSTASVLFGANDFRNNDAAMNEYRIQGENYIRYELDISEVTAEGGAKVNVYRVGHASGDCADTPFKVISTATMEGCNIDELLNEGNKHQPHQIELVCESSKVGLWIDDTPIMVGIDSTFWGKGSATSLLQLNPRGWDDVQAYPLLNDIGFAARAGETAIITDYAVTHYREPCATIFGESIGATFSIFENLKGITVNGNSIVVNGGKNGILAYADPSCGAVPMLRTELALARRPAKAKLYATSRGIHEIYLNGRRVGSDYFNPGSSEYRKTICYTAHDVTELLQQGNNAVGAILASGWWSDMMSFMEVNTNFFGDRQSLLLKLVLTYEDGTVQTVVSEPDSWKCFNGGPIKYASFFQGERYDARDEIAVEGWSQPSYDDSAWVPAAVVPPIEPNVHPAIVSKVDTGVRIYEILDSDYVGEFRKGTGTYIYDMGINMVGVPRITLDGKHGQRITIRTAEILYPDLPEYRGSDINGMLMVENLREALSTDFYICKEGVQTIEPRFTYHGYRYIEISGIDAPLPAEAVKGVVLSSVEAMTGLFESSNPLVNQLFANIQRSHLGNFLSIPTDCPQRNERMGWGESLIEFARTSSFNSSIKNFYENFMRILVDSQVTQELIDAQHVAPGFGAQIPGMYPSYAPAYNASRSWGTPWSCVGILVPWEVYMQYGSTGIIRDHYASMTFYMDAMERLLIPGCRYLAADGGFCGDWLSIDKPPFEYTDASVYVYSAGCMAAMSEAIGETNRARHYQELYANAKAEWNDRYVDPDTGRMNGNAGESQSSYTIALYYGLLEDRYRQTAVDRLMNKVEEGYNGVPYSITTGLYTTPLICLVLSQNGRSDAAYEMIENTRYPSWLYSVTQGATSMWERWNSYTIDAGFGGNNNMNSFNHFSLGGIGAWLYNFALGIDRDETKVGMKHFILQPALGGSFTYARGQTETPYGMIKSAWRSDESGNLASYEAAVPANSSAALYLPVHTDSVIDIRTSGVEFLGMTTHNGKPAAKFDIASGGYAFNVNEGVISVDAQDGIMSSTSLLD